MTVRLFACLTGVAACGDDCSLTRVGSRFVIDEVERVFGGRAETILDRLGAGRLLFDQWHGVLCLGRFDPDWLRRCWSSEPGFFGSEQFDLT